MMRRFCLLTLLVYTSATAGRPAQDDRTSEPDSREENLAPRLTPGSPNICHLVPRHVLCVYVQSSEQINALRKRTEPDTAQLRSETEASRARALVLEQEKH